VFAPCYWTPPHISQMNSNHPTFIWCQRNTTVGARIVTTEPSTLETFRTAIPSDTSLTTSTYFSDAPCFQPVVPP
jgi:hypothetical protein